MGVASPGPELEIKGQLVYWYFIYTLCVLLLVWCCLSLGSIIFNSRPTVLKLATRLGSLNMELDLPEQSDEEEAKLLIEKLTSLGEVK